MKNYFSLLLLLLGLAKISLGQEKGGYIQNSALSRFEGKWQFAANGQVFDLILKKEKTFQPNINMYVDYIVGYHSFKKDGKLAQSSVLQNPILRIGTDYFRSKSDTLYAKYQDVESKKYGDCVIILNPGNKKEVTLEIREKEGFKINSTDRSKFTIPEKMKLKKVG